jgi:hypothetical protein
MAWRITPKTTETFSQWTFQLLTSNFGHTHVLRTYPNSFDAALVKLKQNADLPIAHIFLEALEVNQFKLML